MTLRTMQWTLFAAMACTVPVYFFPFGILPLFFLALAGLRSTDSVWWLLSGVHLALYSPILLLITRLVAKSLLDCTEHRRWYFVGGLVVALLLIGLMPMYGMGNNSIKFYNVYKLYWLLFQKHGF